MENIIKILNQYNYKELLLIAKRLNIKNINNSNEKLIFMIALTEYRMLANSNLTINNKVLDNCLKNYEIKNLIGTGSYSWVYELIKDYKKYAVKIMDLDEIGTDYFLKEKQIIEQLDKLNIGPKLILSEICKEINMGIIITEKWDYDLQVIDDIYVNHKIDDIKSKITFYNDELKNIKKKEKKLEIEEQLKILKTELLNKCIISQKLDKKLDKNLIDRLKSQIKTIHNLGYIHLDIKPDNILIKIKDNKIVDITLTDFGSIKKKSELTLDDVKIWFRYHNVINPNFYEKLSFQDLQKNPELFDYSLLDKLNV
jgi:serine/threonine protein kinase